MSANINSMEKNQKEKWFQYLFFLGVILKAVNAVIELAGGIVIFLVSKAFIVTTILALTQEELLEDPKDLIANYFITSAHTLTAGTQYFIALYLIVHGAIKIVLSISLLKKKLWAYPTALVVFGLFVLYQVFRWSVSGSVWYLILTLIDLVLIYLTWHEYKNLKPKLVS